MSKRNKINSLAVSEKFIINFNAGENHANI